MASIGIRKLSENPSKVITEIQSSGQPMIVTNHREPVALIVPIDKDQFGSQVDELVLAAAPEFAQSRRLADEAVQRGTVRELHDGDTEVDESLDEGIRVVNVRVFGAEAADAIGAQMREDIESIASTVVASLAPDEGTSDPETRDRVKREVKSLNARFFQTLVLDVADAATQPLASAGLSSALNEARESEEGLVGRALAGPTVAAVRYSIGIATAATSPSSATAT